MKGNLFYKLPQDLAARRDLTAAQKIVWAVIRDRIGTNGKAWPGCLTIAKDAGLNRSTVIGAIRRLELRGLLLVERRENGQRNYYRFPDRISTADSQNKDSSGKTQPVGKSGLNQTDPVNQTHTTTKGRSKRKSQVAWNAKDRQFVVAPVLLTSWKRDYPALNVTQELAKAGQWYAANPKKQKKDLQRFLVNWLNRATGDSRSAKKRTGTFTPAETGQGYNKLSQKFT